MIYRRPGFLAVVWLGSFPPNNPPSPVSKLSLFLNFSIFLSVARWAYWRERGGGRGGGGAKSYDGEKAWNNRRGQTSFAPQILSCCSFSTTYLVLSLSEGVFIFFFLVWVKHSRVIHRWSGTVVYHRNFSLSMSWCFEGKILMPPLLLGNSESSSLKAQFRPKYWR